MVSRGGFGSGVRSGEGGFRMAAATMIRTHWSARDRHGNQQRCVSSCISSFHACELYQFQSVKKKRRGLLLVRVIPHDHRQRIGRGGVMCFASRNADTAKSRSGDEVNEEAEESTSAVEIGSMSYYKGFFSSPLQDRIDSSKDDLTKDLTNGNNDGFSQSQRGDGTIQAVKMALSTSIVLLILFILFLTSNNII